MEIGKYGESRFLKAADLEPGQDMALLIENITEESVTDQGTEKLFPCLWFKGKKKGFGLSAKINREMCAHNFGSRETDDWVGRKVTIYRTMTEFHGKPVPCVRIRPKEEEAGATAGAATVTNVDPAEFADDDIPF